MTVYDLHVHTTFSDGECTPAEMARAAAEKGIRVLGFSDHSYTSFDESWCMPRARGTAYRRAVRELAAAYRGKMDVYCGIEQDYYADEPPVGYDYVIGSVHYLRVGGDTVPVDEGTPYLRAAADRHFGGDVYALTRLYYETVADVVRKTNADIIGHFDLIACGNEQEPLFDERDPRYTRAWQAAASALLETGRPFEINTRALLRGTRTVPYPRPEIVAYLAERGAKFVFSGDAHDTAGLMFGFDEWRARYGVTEADVPPRNT